MLWKELFEVEKFGECSKKLVKEKKFSLKKRENELFKKKLMVPYKMWKCPG
jgi:hypothetical protein